MRKYIQGRYTVKNPSKYVGNVNNVIFRSSWELRVLQWLDETPGVIHFSSEELVIPYYDPVSCTIRRYFPDFLVKVLNKSGDIRTYVLEVKPWAQTQLRIPKKQTRKYIKEVTTYTTNEAKWKAAKIFCESQQWEFKVITEFDLGIVT